MSWGLFIPWGWFSIACGLILAVLLFLCAFALAWMHRRAALDGVFLQSGEGLVVLDGKGRILRANTAALGIFGPGRSIGTGELSGLSGNLPELAAPQAANDGSPLAWQSPDGRDFEVSRFPLRGFWGGRTGFLLSFHDVSRLCRAERCEREQRILAESLRDAAISFASAASLETALDRILDGMEKVLPDGIRHIMAVDEKGIARVARFRSFHDPSMERWLERSSFPVDQVPFFASMAASGEPLLLADTRDYPDWPFWLKRIRSFLGMPLILRGRLLGFVDLGHPIPGRYRASDLGRIKAFAGLASIALENARMFEMIRDLAGMDDLTQVDNRRNFFIKAHREYNRAIRYGEALSALMIDVDRFKATNDELGHQSGDQALRWTASALRVALRDVDILGRYGGDEFCALLPATGEEDAIIVAERLLDAVRSAKVPVEGGEIPVSVSIGAATLREGDRHLEDLIRRADKALYAAKREGRDRVVALP